MNIDTEDEIGGAGTRRRRSQQPSLRETLEAEFAEGERARQRAAAARSRPARVTTAAASPSQGPQPTSRQPRPDGAAGRASRCLRRCR
jgi:hypothetical protein